MLKRNRPADGARPPHRPRAGFIREHERRARPDGWRGVRVPGIGRSGLPSTRTQLEEQRTGERGDAARGPGPAPCDRTRHASRASPSRGEPLAREPLAWEPARGNPREAPASKPDLPGAHADEPEDRAQHCALPAPLAPTTATISRAQPRGSPCGAPGSRRSASTPDSSSNVGHYYAAHRGRYPRALRAAGHPQATHMLWISSQPGPADGAQPAVQAKNANVDEGLTLRYTFIGRR